MLNKMKQGSSSFFTVQELRDLFKNNPDVGLQTFTFENNKVTFITCEGMVDAEAVNNVIYERFVLFFARNKQKKLTEEEIIQSLYVPAIQRIKNENTTIAEIVAGKLLVLFHK